MRTTSPWDVWNAFLHEKTILMCKSQHFNPIGITCSKPIPTYKQYTFWSVRAILHLYALVTSIHNHAAIMYVGTSKGTSTYWFYDFPENRRSPVYDAIQESHPRKRLVQSFLYTLILYKTPIQTYRNEKLRITQSYKTPLSKQLEESFNLPIKVGT